MFSVDLKLKNNVYDTEQLYYHLGGGANFAETAAAATTEAVRFEADIVVVTLG